ncbi:MAG: hypothetical protein NWF05_05585 [Candidatus Bathyarchaeota archaeon]|nr:hypothetical protein [Candidatus Bathyarchaeota archaeon]
MRRRKNKGDYLAYLTVKYDVHPDLLFCALLSAGEIGKAKCGTLSVECRGKVGNQIYFLIRNDSDVVAQFPVSEEFMAKQRNPIRNYMETDMVQNYKPDESEGPFYSKISDLKVGKKHVNLRAKVVKVSKPLYVSTKFGSQIRLAKALLRDETGEINLCLWRKQVEAVSKGDFIEVENVYVTNFRGVKQLTLSSKGTLKKVADAQQKDSLLLESSR